MADYFVDHGAYASNLGATPTWGVPQEGDGSATTAATAASIGSIKFTTVPTTGTISVCGASVSTTSVIGAASADAAANALATNINATTNTVSASAAFGTPQLRNLVYARGPAGGAAAGTCEIMARVGSASLNNATNSSAAITSTFDGTPVVTQFAGGSGGCWGWLFNDVALGASSSIGIASYGIGIAKPYVFPAGVATLALTDYVWCRSTSGKSIDTGGNYWSRGNLGFPLNLVVDTNTKWTGDSGTGVVKIIIKCNTSSNVGFRPDFSGSNNGVFIGAIMKGGFRVEYDLSNGSTTFTISTTGMCRLYHVDISEKPGASLGASSFFSMSAAGNGSFHMASCSFTSLNARPSLPQQFLQLSSYSGYWNFEDCDFNFNLSGSQSTIDTVGLLSMTAPTGVIRFDGCRFSTGSTSKLKWFSNVITPNTFQVILERNTGVRIGSSGMGIQGVAFNQRTGDNLPSLSLASADQGYSFRHERTSGIVDWDYELGTYPYLAATQPDGTPYSVCIQWFANYYVQPCAPLATPKITKLNRLADGVRTVSVEMLVESGKTFDSGMIALQVSYLDTSNIVRRETSYLNATLSTSTASWTFRGSNFNTYLSKKLSFNTSYSVKSNSEIAVEVVVLNNPPGNALTNVFVCPEFVLS